MRKTLLQLSIFMFCVTGIQDTLIAQEKTSLNQVVNTLKKRISLPISNRRITLPACTGFIP